MKDVAGLLLKDQTFPLLLGEACHSATLLEVDLGMETSALEVELGPLGNLGGLLGLGNLSAAQGINYRTDALSCTVFVSNVSYQ